MIAAAAADLCGDQHFTVGDGLAAAGVALAIAGAWAAWCFRRWK